MRASSSNIIRIIEVLSRFEITPTLFSHHLRAFSFSGEGSFSFSVRSPQGSTLKNKTAELFFVIFIFGNQPVNGLSTKNFQLHLISWMTRFSCTAINSLSLELRLDFISVNSTGRLLHLNRWKAIIGWPLSSCELG